MPVWAARCRMGLLREVEGAKHSTKRAVRIVSSARKTTTMEPPPRSITAITPFVAYTGMPQQLLGHRPSPTSVGSANVRKRLAQADARTRHGVRASGKDACHGQAMALKASAAYALARDPQGMAMACMASGKARSAEIAVNRRELPHMEWLAARRRAKDEFLQSAALYEALLQQPQLPYSPERQARLQRAFDGAKDPNDPWEAVLGYP